jgi:phosphoglucosamine mutase
MAICGATWLAKGQLPKKTVVATVMSNIGLERALAEVGGTGRPHAGRRSLRRRVHAQNGYGFGGEQSGTSCSSSTPRPATAASRRCRCWR